MPLHNSGWPRAHFVAQADFELVAILLPQFSQVLELQSVPPLLACNRFLKCKNSVYLILSILCCRTRSHFVVQADLEPSVMSHLSFLSAGITHVCHDTWPLTIF